MCRRKERLRKQLNAATQVSRADQEILDGPVIFVTHTSTWQRPTTWNLLAACCGI